MGRSSSSSSSATNQYDNRVGAEGEAIAFGQGSTVTITDSGAVNAALKSNQEVTEYLLGSGEVLFTDALSFVEGALAAANNTITTSQQQLSTTSREAIALADQFTRSDSTEVLQSAIKWGGIGLAAYLAAKTLK